MKRHWVLAVAAAAAALALPAKADTLRDQAAQQFQAIPSILPAVHNNPITKAKIDLGRALFFDPRLSASCISGGAKFGHGSGGIVPLRAA